MKKWLFVCFGFFLFLSPFFIYQKEENPKKIRILLGSPVRQKPEILKEFLDSLDHLEQKTYTLDYYFVEGNTIPESEKLLFDFAEKKGPRCHLIHEDKEKILPANVCNEVTHYWQEDIIWKIAAFKDEIIEFARDNDYDYLFLIDSDLLIHPRVVDQLIKANKEIVSNIFWTNWVPNTQLLPSVWISDLYTLYNAEIGEKLTQEEALERQFAFLSQLKEPGIYEVGGLSACTLIHKTALHKPISFKRIKNCMLWGEDRHFCLRAAALGISLFVDTHYPAYHIYRDSDLAGVYAFKLRSGY
jgi:hypothetical protein